MPEVKTEQTQPEVQADQPVVEQPEKPARNIHRISQIILASKYAILFLMYFNPYPQVNTSIKIVVQLMTTVNTTEPYAIPAAMILFSEAFQSFGFFLAFLMALICQLTFFFLNTGVMCGFDYFKRKASILVLSAAIPLSFMFGLDSNHFLQTFFVGAVFNASCIVETYFQGYVGVKEVIGGFIYILNFVAQSYGYRNLYCFAMSIVAQDLMLV